MFTWLGKNPLKSWLRPPSTPTRAVEIELRADGEAAWTPATIVSDRPMVQLVAELVAVNASDAKVLLVSARLRKPATEGLVRVHDPDGGTAATRVLEPFASARASVFFFVPLAPPPAGTNVVADVGVLDQFGNTHWLEKVRFRGRALDECDYF
ncbi:MAG TPA: hypothetical protein VEC56_12710 [Candidatus Krumholzibacteria bacterium]|nr:hypothetical protein [Candidatus Krumholzibacteria bacterium]